MIYLLVLSVSGTDVKHLTIHGEQGLGSTKLRFIHEIKSGVFPNLYFQNTFNESVSKNIDDLILGFPTEADAYRAGYASIAEQLCSPNACDNITKISNIGDWLDVPGLVSVDKGDSIATTSIYKLIRGLVTPGFSYTFWPRDMFYVYMRSDKDDIHETHLLPRDDHFNREYRDMNGVRVFMKYEPRTDKSRDSTLGENHHAATAVIINGLEYPTIDAAGLAFNLPGGVVLNRLTNGKGEWSQWRYKDREEAKSVTYILRHADDPGFYIGHTAAPRFRLHTHISKLIRGLHESSKLQEMINKHGIDGLTHEVVFEGPYEECKAKEQELVNLHWGDPNLLNISRNTKSAISHHVQDPEVEKRRVEGLRKAVTTDEHRQKMSDVGKAQWSVPGRKEARSGAGNPFAKCVSIYGIVYGSVIDAVRAKAGGLTDWVIRTRLKAGSDPAIFYCDAEGNKIL